MVEYYKGQSKHLLAVDCVIFGYESGELRLLLYPRSFEPVKGKWSLMGGFIREMESCEEAAARVLLETTGLTDIFLEQVATFSNPHREPGVRVVSVAYYSLIRIHQQDMELLDRHGARWWPLTNLPELIFDHGEMIRKALISLQHKASYSLAGSELLPEKFTLLQLRKLYEAIYQRGFDAGNFRKKVLSLGLLTKTSEMNFTESRKGAHYYTLDREVSDITTERIVKF
ncbi:MAG TPA: NUDIX domain-containing protein [Prolixibacteraceae bacterium]|nr:NUDIX domain-containing protein [Prolixibacteraceae bacterium]HQH76958.1 NUDIX domain-containing protein [Prolixibacteraceae bacterium]